MFLSFLATNKTHFFTISLGTSYNSITSIQYRSIWESYPNHFNSDVAVRWWSDLIEMDHHHHHRPSIFLSDQASVTFFRPTKQTIRSRAAMKVSKRFSREKSQSRQRGCKRVIHSWDSGATPGQNPEGEPGWMLVIKIMGFNFGGLKPHLTNISQSSIGWGLMRF